MSQPLFYLQVNRYINLLRGSYHTGEEKDHPLWPHGDGNLHLLPSHLGYLHSNARARLGGAVFMRNQAGVTAQGG